MPQPLHLSKKIKKICAGEFHSMLVTEDDVLLACGSNGCGELGLGDMKNRASPTEIAQFKNVPIKLLCLGEAFTIVLLHNGDTYTFGHKYRCGTVRTTHCNTPTKLDLKNVIYITAGFHHAILQDKHGKYFGFCDPDLYAGQFGMEQVPSAAVIEITAHLPKCKGIKQIVAFGDCSMLLTDDGLVYGCGFNSAFELVSFCNIYRIIICRA